VFASLPADYPLPILVAQHMSEGFVESFVRWLDSQSAIRVCTAVDGERPAASVAYFAPPGHHLSVRSDRRLALEPGDADPLCPSVDRLFSSVADAFGAQAVCLLLTGMGTDGAEGLLVAKRRHGLTAVQDEETSVVFGMPGEALRLHAADVVLSAGEIAAWLVASAAPGGCRSTA
jgi:two-component system chemotaxis response regulator CheB